MEYIRELTEFRAYEAPYTDKIFIKDGDKTEVVSDLAYLEFED